jgi:hypothetical protein
VAFMSATPDVFPKTTPECDRILRSAVLALENPYVYYRSKAHNLIEQLYEKRCERALGWIYEKYRLHPMLHVRSLAREAREYKKNLKL